MRKLRITTLIDHDVVAHLKEQATAQGVGYQTLLNQRLRDAIGLPVPPVSDHVGAAFAAIGAWGGPNLTAAIDSALRGSPA